MYLEEHRTTKMLQRNGRKAFRTLSGYLSNPEMLSVVVRDKAKVFFATKWCEIYYKRLYG